MKLLIRFSFIFEYF